MKQIAKSGKKVLFVATKKQAKQVVADNRFQRSELDYLIYNDPLAYADLVLNGDPEAYLNAVTDYDPPR